MGKQLFQADVQKHCQESQQKTLEREKHPLEHHGVSVAENGEGISKRPVNGEAMSRRAVKAGKASSIQEKRDRKEKRKKEQECMDSHSGENKEKIKKRKGPVFSDCFRGSLSGTMATESENIGKRNFLDTGSYKKQQQKKKPKITERNGSMSSDFGKLDQQNNSILKVYSTHKGSKRYDAISRTNNHDDDSKVTVSGRGSHKRKYQPCKSFQDLNVPQQVLECCRNFQNPSPIQAHAWPFLLGGRDLIGIAATGSGKTLAFAVPALVHAVEKRSSTYKQNFPVCLILSPTRELAQQIAVVLEDAGSFCGVKTVCLYGGSSKKTQVAALKFGVGIIVATPGRLQDLLEEGTCHINSVSFLVLDEADRMLDLGFEPAVRAIVRHTSKSRQTIMFSATWPATVDQLSNEFMQGHDPIKVVVGSQDLAANHDVTQIVEVLGEDARDSRLMALLDKYHQSSRNRILVFVLYKKEAVRVENFVRKRGWNVTAVHGDKGQYDRNKALASFKDGTCPLLIATDVAARGLDIPDVEYVINYSFPLTTEDYVHRIGRTGRAGKSGVAHTFFTHADKQRAGELVNVLREAGQAVPSELLRFGTHVKKKESKLYGAHFKEVLADAPKATKITFDSDDE